MMNVALPSSHFEYGRLDSQLVKGASGRSPCVMIHNTCASKEALSVDAFTAPACGTGMLRGMLSGRGTERHARPLVSSFYGARVASPSSIRGRGLVLLDGNCSSTNSKASKKIRRAGSTSARLFGPAIFEMHKLQVLFLSPDVDDNHSHPEEAVRERCYTLTHSDVTAKITLSVAREFNISQFSGWYKKFHRDEVLAVWKSVNSQPSLHIHCHISGGGNWLHKKIAGFRYYIFRKELPVVIEAFRNGDKQLFQKYPKLEDALVWVHFHSCIREFHRRECWGPFTEAAKVPSWATYRDIATRLYRGVPEAWPLLQQVVSEFKD